MNSDNGKNNKAERLLRNKIARSIFTYAETLGISDRNELEQLTDRVLDRLEPVPTFQGWEDLAPMTRRPVQDVEIQAMVRSILDERKKEEPIPEPAPIEEKEKRKPAKTAKRITPMKVEIAKGKTTISPNARAVLERRYLVKDEKGKVIES
ncbi:MAG TPA: hypothetical protein VMW64_08685, partial [Dehalococcoidia bacterium]|nr:hypothetical protein [Dehalococcoidia bacterium]